MKRISSGRIIPIAASLCVLWALLMPPKCLAGPITFADGATLSGFFVYDPNINTIISWDIAVQGGNQQPFLYTDIGEAFGPSPNNTNITVLGFGSGPFQGPFRILVLDVAGDLNAFVAAFEAGNHSEEVPLLTASTPETGSQCAADNYSREFEGNQFNPLFCRDMVSPAFLSLTDPPLGLITFSLTSTPPGPPSIPEPCSFLLMATGLVGLTSMARKDRLGLRRVTIGGLLRRRS